MKYFRKAFTLVELLVSITILSIMMLFLYKTYASLNISNSAYKEKVESIKGDELKKEVLFLDFSLVTKKNITIINQEKTEDVVFFQTSNSIHKRYNPYIAYFVNESKLYRLESLKEFKEFPIREEREFSIDYLGEVNSFRVYRDAKKINNTVANLFLIHIDFKHSDNILLKVKILNEF